jgi:hypothetical protein
MISDEMLSASPDAAVAVRVCHLRGSVAAPF